MKRLLIVLLTAAALTYGLSRWRQTQMGARPTPLTVFCAAGLKRPVEAIAEEYRKTTGQEISLQFGGTGTLLSQLRIAKIGDVFLAADETSMVDAQKHGLIRGAIPLVVQHPVIAVAKGNPHGIATLDDLLKAEVKLALPDAESASIGKVCKKLLGAKWTALAAKAAVSKLTVTEIAADVKLGAADAAIVWDSVVPQFEGIEAVKVAELSIHEEKAMAAVLMFSKEPEAAMGFARYLVTPEQGGAIFDRYGFQSAARASP